MSSYIAEMTIGSNTFKVLDADISYYQHTRGGGMPSSEIQGGTFTVKIETSSGPQYEMLSEWMFGKLLMKEGFIRFYKKDGMGRLFDFEFYDAHCINYREHFDYSSNQPMITGLTISPGITRMREQVKERPWKVSELSNWDNVPLIIGTKARDKTILKEITEPESTKKSRYEERLDLVAKSEKYLDENPSHENNTIQEATERLKRNNTEIIRAKAAHCVYLDDVPEKYSDELEKVSKEKLKELGLDNPKLWNDKMNGFHAEIYYSKLEDKYIVAFEGTKWYDPRDWFANLKQALGFKSGQYEKAMHLAQEVKEKLNGNVVFSGHSLGGALASAAGIVTNLKTTTLNAAGLHPETVASKGISETVLKALQYNINAYYNKTDPLNLAQDHRAEILQFLGTTTDTILHLPGIGSVLGSLAGSSTNILPTAKGNRIKLDANLHSVENVIVGIEKQKEEDIEKLKQFK